MNNFLLNKNMFLINMKNLNNFINEASVEDKKFKGIPVKELYKNLIIYF